MSSKMPKWIEDLGDDKFKVTCKHGVFILEEKDGDTFETCKTLAQQMKGTISLEQFLIMRSIIEPTINETDFGKLKGSDYMKLLKAISYIYGLEDFLPEEETENNQ